MREVTPSIAPVNGRADRTEPLGMSFFDGHEPSQTIRGRSGHNVDNLDVPPRIPREFSRTGTRPAPESAACLSRPAEEQGVEIWDKAERGTFATTRVRNSRLRHTSAPLLLARAKGMRASLEPSAPLVYSRDRGLHPAGRSEGENPVGWLRFGSLGPGICNS